MGFQDPLSLGHRSNPLDIHAHFSFRGNRTDHQASRMGKIEMQLTGVAARKKRLAGGSGCQFQTGRISIKRLAQQPTKEATSEDKEGMISFEVKAPGTFPFLQRQPLEKPGTCGRELIVPNTPEGDMLRQRVYQKLADGGFDQPGIGMEQSRSTAPRSRFERRIHRNRTTQLRIDEPKSTQIKIQQKAGPLTPSRAGRA